MPTPDLLTPVHELLARASCTDASEWRPCDGPRPGKEALYAWFVREKDGQPDVYAVVSGPEDEVTVELIPAASGEADAYAVARGVLAGEDADVTPDLECGVVHRGPVADDAPTP